MLQPYTTHPNLLNDLSSVCLMLPAAHHLSDVCIWCRQLHTNRRNLSDHLSSVYLMTPAAHQPPELVERFILCVSDADSHTPTAETCQTIYPLCIWWLQLHTNHRSLSNDLSSVYPMPPAAHQPPELVEWFILCVSDAASRKPTAGTWQTWCWKQEIKFFLSLCIEQENGKGANSLFVT